MATIKEVEGQAEKSKKLNEALRELGFMLKGYEPQVRVFRGKKGGRRRDASFEKYWSPDADSIRIRFQPASQQPQEEGQSVEPQGAPRPEAIAEHVTPAAVTASLNHTAQSGSRAADHLSDLIRALDRAESRPGFGFVALKWFRDTALPEEIFPWANDHSTKQAMLREAIDRRLILTSKMPNPKSPEFPVTAIRLNRLMPEVRDALGNPQASVFDFEPIPIRGEALSQTVLRDRR